jgi:spermidine synthase
MRIGLAAVGFTATIAQVVLMRELVATLYGNELLFGIVLAVWLAWVALGSWGLGRLSLRSRPEQGGRKRWEGERGRRAFAVGLMLEALLLPVEIALVRGSRTLLGVTPGALVGFGPLVGAVIVVLAPLCLLGGTLFTLGTRLVVERGGDAGQAYVSESGGAVVGGVLFSFALIRWLDPFQTALLVAAINLTVALSLLRPETWNLRRSLIGFVPMIVLALLAGPYLHSLTLSWQWSDLAFAADSPYGRLTVQARDGQRVFFENGLLAFETQGLSFPEEVAHFPLLMHPDPRQVLLVGGGVAGDLREILKHPVAGVTYVELDPLLIEAAQAHLPPEDGAVLSDPRVTLILTDGRLYVKQANRAFDVVILDLPEPSTGALNRFYTREFFAEVWAALDPGGVFALGLPSAENYWSPELARRNASVYHTLRAVFPEVVVLPGEHNFYLASDTPLETEPGVLAGRLAERGVETRWVTPGTIEYVLTTDRFAGVQSQLEGTADVRLNRDLAPICYYYDLALWFSRLYPASDAGQIPILRRVYESAGQLNLWWVVVPLVILVLLARWRSGMTRSVLSATEQDQPAWWAVSFVVGTIGLAEMTLQVVILFGFQVLHGTIYAQVSLIVTAFMAGLALGGAVGQRLAPGGQRAADGRRIKRTLIFVQSAVVIYSALFPLILSLPVPAPALVFPLLALVAGLLTGIAFPLAVALVQGDVGRVAGGLFGADLVGGCVGALLGAVLFVPVLGIPQTCAAIALVGLAGLLVLV